MLQVCSAAATYASDGPNDFDVPPSADIPAAVRDAAANADGTVGHYKAPAVGNVYVVTGAFEGFHEAVSLYDRNGTLLIVGEKVPQGWLWSYESADVDGPVDCSNTPYNVNGWLYKDDTWDDASTNYSGSSSSGGWEAPDSGN